MGLKKTEQWAKLGRKRRQNIRQQDCRKIVRMTSTWNSSHYCNGRNWKTKKLPLLVVPWCCIHARPVHLFNFFLVSAFLSTHRGPCRSEAPSTARAAPGDHKPLIGGARWRSMGELRLGRSVTWSFCGWTYRQSTAFSMVPRLSDLNSGFIRQVRYITCVLLFINYVKDCSVL